MKPAWFLLQVCCLSWAAVAADFTWTTNHGAITITKYNGSGGDVTIPNELTGFPVTTIGSGAFYLCTRLTKVTVADSVTTIGTNAFYYCTGLTNAILGTNVVTIGTAAFTRCSSLVSLTIPERVAVIGRQAFDSCLSLTTVTIPDSVTSMGDNAFYSCTGLTNLTIGTNLSVIGGSAFSRCSSLTRLVIPNGVTSIGTAAFVACTRLGTVTIAGSVTNLGANAFFGCTSLTNLVIPSSVIHIGAGPLAACTSLAAIAVDPGNPCYTSVGGVLFDKALTTLIQCPGGQAGSYTIPTSVTSIGATAFHGCANLTNVTLGAGVTSIGSSAFSACPRLTSITVDPGNSLYRSVEGVLCDHGATTLILCPVGIGGNYTVPESITYIGDAAFLGCTNLTNVTMGTNVTSIGVLAFGTCGSLSGVYLRGDAPSIGGEPFGDETPNVTIYYLPGTSGWDTSYGDRPVLCWNPQIQTTDPGFGVHSDGFGFSISGTTDIPLVVEASPVLTATNWLRIHSCTLTGGIVHFRDADWTDYAARFYRLCAP
jgi:hypothetical protein